MPQPRFRRPRDEISVLLRDRERIREAELAEIRRKPQHEMKDFWVIHGWFRKGTRIPGRAHWKEEPETKVEAIRYFVEEVLKTDPRNVNINDFFGNGLNGLMSKHFDSSPYAAIHAAYPEVRPWEMKACLPHNYFEDKANRVDAVHWLVEKLKKKPTELTNEDFTANGLYDLLKFQSDSRYAAVLEAFPDIKPWEMAKVPMGTYQDPATRRKAIRALVLEILRIDPLTLSQKQMSDAGFSRVGEYYKDQYEMVKDAFPELDPKPWQMNSTPDGYFDKKENRIEATQWLVKKTGKRPVDLRRKDFGEHGLEGMLAHRYNGSIYAAVSEAYEGIMPWQMKKAPQGFYHDKANCGRAFRWLLRESGKTPEDLRPSDFLNRGLSGLYAIYRYDIPSMVKDLSETSVQA